MQEAVKVSWVFDVISPFAYLAFPQLSRLPAHVSVEFVPVVYDHERLARDMRGEGLPEEFVETILTGWWTTCLEVLPARERESGRF